MSTREQLVRSRLGVLTLAQRLKNVSLACRITGISRAHFYRIKKAYDEHGKDGLVPQSSRLSQRALQVTPEMERLILMTTAHHPTIPRAALVTRLKLDGISVSPEMVQVVWRKYHLTTRAARVAWMGQPRLRAQIADENSSPPVSQDDEEYMPAY